MKPEGNGVLVRAYNGGSFFVVSPDEHKPETACKVFGLTNINYNGRVPKFEFVMSKIVSRDLNKLRENMIKGYKVLYTKLRIVNKERSLNINPKGSSFLRLCLKTNTIISPPTGK